MLLYTIFLSCISIFFYIEGKSVKQGTSRYLSDFNANSTVAQAAAKELFLIALSSAISAILMLFSFFYGKLMHTLAPPIILALSFLIYGGGFIIGMYRCYKLKKKINE